MHFQEPLDESGESRPHPIISSGAERDQVLFWAKGWGLPPISHRFSPKRVIYPITSAWTEVFFAGAPPARRGDVSN